MIRYAALSSAGHRYKSEDRDRVDAWCAERVKLGESCEVFARNSTVINGGQNPERVGYWRPPGGIDNRDVAALLESMGRNSRTLGHRGSRFRSAHG